MAESPAGEERNSEGGRTVPAWLRPDGGEPGRDRRCAFCGEEAPRDSAFCPNDGRALTAAILPGGSRPLTVLFTDIEDSVLLNERLGDIDWAHLVDEHNGIVRVAVDQHAGFEVKVTGDGFLVIFGDAASAVRCAIAIQRGLEAAAAHRLYWPVQVRIGIHTGAVILRPGGDVLGRTVNIAQRIMYKADGGEIWASTAVRAGAAAVVEDRRWIDRGPRRLRGVTGRHPLHELDWAATAPPEEEGAGRAVEEAAGLEVGGRSPLRQSSGQASTGSG